MVQVHHPDELFDLIRNAGLTPVDRKGFVFNPVSWSWRSPTAICR
jgi:2-polyprenyl-6-hydroxyphenyl methylase/3-demethylubiquinone-9 3-methyltransferase